MITYLWSLDCEMSESEIEILLAARGRNHTIKRRDFPLLILESQSGR